MPTTIAAPPVGTSTPDVPVGGRAGGGLVEVVLLAGVGDELWCGGLGVGLGRGELVAGGALVGATLGAELAVALGQA